MRSRPPWCHVKVFINESRAGISPLPNAKVPDALRAKTVPVDLDEYRYLHQNLMVRPGVPTSIGSGRHQTV